MNILRRAALILSSSLVLAQAFYLHAAEPIKIGIVSTLTGPLAEAGHMTTNGIQIALEEINNNGGVLGRPLELRVEDNGSTNPGTVLAFSKLTTESGVAAIIGPVFSTQIQAASPTIAKAGIPTMIGGSDPSLTRVNNRWIFRGRPNDLYSARVIADFGVNTLKRRKWAIVHAADAFGTGGAKALTEALEKLGVTPILDQGYVSNSQDFTAIVLALKRSEVDILGTYTTVPADLAIFAKQLRQLGINIQWIGSAAMTTVSSLNLAGEALYGTYGVTDFAIDASDLTRAFAKRYRDRYGSDPDQNATWSYDALHLLALAIKSANSTEPEALRQAMLTISGYQGLEGTYQFDKTGEGLHGVNVVRNENGKILFIKRVDFQKQ